MPRGFSNRHPVLTLRLLVHKPAAKGLFILPVTMAACHVGNIQYCEVALNQTEYDGWINTTFKCYLAMADEFLEIAFYVVDLFMHASAGPGEGTIEPNDKRSEGREGADGVGVNI